MDKILGKSFTFKVVYRRKSIGRPHKQRRQRGPSIKLNIPKIVTTSARTKPQLRIPRVTGIFSSVYNVLAIGLPKSMTPSVIVVSVTNGSTTGSETRLLMP